MKSSILTTSAAALLVFGAAATQARAATPQHDRQGYTYERRADVRDHRAFDNGERDGFARGTDDVRHHRHADMNRQKWYRSGDHDYDRHWGSKDEYRAEYRRGFEQGYDRAFREGPRR